MPEVASLPLAPRSAIIGRRRHPQGIGIILYDPPCTLQKSLVEAPKMQAEAAVAKVAMRTPEIIEEHAITKKKQASWHGHERGRA